LLTVFIAAHCYSLSVHEVFPCDNVWMCIGAYHITQKKFQVGVSSRGISGQ